MSNSQIIASIIGLIGVGLASFLGALGYLLRTRNEQKKVSKRVLFNLLEIYHAVQLSKISSTKITDQYLELACQTIREVAGEEFNPPAGFRNLINVAMSEILKTQNYHSIENLTDKYVKCVSDMSEYAPILAFQLNGRERLFQKLRYIDEYNCDFAAFLQNNTKEENIDFAKSAQDVVKIEVVDDMLKDLAKDVLSVAWKAGIMTYFATIRKLRLLNKRKVDLNEDDEIKIKMENLVKLACHYKKETVPL